MSLITQLHGLASEMAAEFKALKQKIAGNTSGDLTGLATTDKTSMVASVNEVKTSLAGKQPMIGFTPEDASMKGAPNGYASLDASAKVPASQLPAFVDDVEEYDTLGSFPATGRQDVIYYEKAFNNMYRWAGSTYVQISQNLALGILSNTAIRGDYGKTAYNHSQYTGLGHVLSWPMLNEHPVTVAGFGITDLHTATDVGSPSTGFVAIFEAALV